MAAPQGSFHVSSTVALPPGGTKIALNGVGAPKPLSTVSSVASKRCSVPDGPPTSTEETSVPEAVYGSAQWISAWFPAEVT